MFGFLKQKIIETYEDLGYHVKRAMALHAGKEVAKGTESALKESTGEGLAEGGGQVLAESAKDASMFTGKNLAGLAGVAIMVGLSVGLSQVDHIHRRRRLRDTYRKEIAAGMGKSEAQVSDADLDAVAYGDPQRGVVGNGAIRQAVEHSDLHRRVGTGLSIVSSLVAFAITATLFAAGGPLAIGGAAQFALHMAVSGVCYFAVKMPVHWIGGKMLGLDEPTADDKIHGIQRDLEKGRAISQEQVFEAYLSGNQSLDAVVRAEFGRSFKKMDAESKIAVLQTIGRDWQVDQVTAAINAGRMRPTEIAFASQGERSGVPLGEGVNAKSRWASRLEGLRHRFGFGLGSMAGMSADLVTSARNGGKLPATAAAPANCQTRELTNHALEAQADTMAEEARRASFVDRLGNRRHDPALTHVQRLQGEELGAQAGR